MEGRSRVAIRTTEGHERTTGVPWRGACVSLWNHRRLRANDRCAMEGRLRVAMIHMRCDMWHISATYVMRYVAQR